MSSTQLTFSSKREHRDWLKSQGQLPQGFRVGTVSFGFVPEEAPKPSRMTMTLIALDEPTELFAAVFTKNAFPGAPVIVGRRRLSGEKLGAILVNNKISNVCAPGGVETAEALCENAARELGFSSGEMVLPSSTGVIGWRLPKDAMAKALPDMVKNLSGDSILPAAEGIVTTDLYPKVRSAQVCGGRIVGIAKGAGMIEPNMATMLSYVLTDVAVPRGLLREMLARVVNKSFNRISIDSDTSTSDTVVLLSSGKTAFDQGKAVEFEAALTRICLDLSEDVVRNGEGVRHVMRVHVKGALDEVSATSLGKAIVNAPLFKCAVAGNDPNVGRLIQVIGKHAGLEKGLDVSKLCAAIGGVEIFSEGEFHLNREKESALTEYLKKAELYESTPTADGVFKPGVDYPPHEHCVEIEVDLGQGAAEAVVFGADLTHEYVTENADYRS